MLLTLRIEYTSLNNIVASNAHNYRAIQNKIFIALEII